MRITENGDKELVKEIREKLKDNREKYGKQYCPCVLPSLYGAENSGDYICMCKEFLEQKNGECHCGLYVKYED